jgi:CRP/FNR family transcriptional regulator, cyclic AMP receptor protein
MKIPMELPVITVSVPVRSTRIDRRLPELDHRTASAALGLAATEPVGTLTYIVRGGTNPDIGVWRGFVEFPMPSSHRSATPSRRAQKRIKRFDLKSFLANAGIGRTLQHYRAKQAIFSQGERAAVVFYIQTGGVRLSVLSKQGKEATIALLGPGDFLGEDCIASDQPFRTATAIASTDCSVLKIENRALLRTLHEENELSDMFVAYVVGRHNRTQADLVDQLFNSSEKRLARALLILARSGKAGKSEVVVPGISQEVLAEMIRTTRSHVNVFMNKFRKLGFIEYNGGLMVHSSLLSVVLHD